MVYLFSLYAFDKILIKNIIHVNKIREQFGSTDGVYVCTELF